RALRLADRAVRVVHRERSREAEEAPVLRDQVCDLVVRAARELDTMRGRAQRLDRRMSEREDLPVVVAELFQRAPACLEVVQDGYAADPLPQVRRERAGLLEHDLDELRREDVRERVDPQHEPSEYARIAISADVPDLFPGRGACVQIHRTSSLSSPRSRLGVT